MWPRKKPSGAQFRKAKVQRQMVSHQCKKLMKNFIKSNDSQASRNEANSLTVNSSIGDSSSSDETEKDVMVVGRSEEKSKKEDTESSSATNERQIAFDNMDMEESEEIVPPHEIVEAAKIDQQSTNDSDNIQNAISDIGSWPKNMSPSFRDFIVNGGPGHIQNKNGPFYPDETGRSLKETWFLRTHKNGEKTERTWMCYSISKKSLFCFCCTLFPQKNHQSSFSSETGFSTWKKLNPRIEDHENSHSHRSSFMVWKDLERSMKIGGMIDDRLEQQIRDETKLWKNILERIIATIHTLAQQNLALRGHRESITANTNPGNFLALINYLSKFDPVMKSHVKSVTANPQSCSYFSHDIQNEIVSLLGNNVRKSIITAIKDAIYFSISFDTTPDSSHDEQMSQIIRYVVVKRNSVEIKESFIDFISIKTKNAEGITNEILEKLEQDTLDLKNCRGQSYDNQATMAGVHSGVQQRILDRHPLAVFIPCNNHSLNLVGVHAAHVNPQAITFFGTIERIYTFFSKSTHRWDVLKEFVEVTVKRQSDTRWSANAEAVNSISTQLNEVLLALEKLRDTPTETVDTRQDAALIINAIERFYFIVLLFFWADILRTIDKMQKMFQTVEISFHESLILLETLNDHLNEWRTSFCDTVILKAKKLCEKMGINIQKRRKKVPKMPGELADDAVIDSDQETKRVLVEILDKVTVEVSNRFSSLKELKRRFGFLCTFEKYLVDDQKAHIENLLEIEEKCDFLAGVYSNDLNGNDLYNDIKDPERIRLRDSRYKNALHYCAAQSVARTGDLVAAASIAVAAPELLESADEDGFTPLHLAVIQGNLAMVNLLLANKADVNAVDKEAHSVVHWATVCGEVGALRAVLAAGANVTTPDINGGSPLHYAAQMCGATYEGKLSQANSHKLALEILGILLQHPQCSVDAEDKDGRQPLLWAASAGSAKALLALVNAGARVESADKDGLTALHCAASRGHTECIDALISLCGAPTDLIDSNGCTALHYAVTLGHADATSRLLDLEADPNRQDRKGRTPAHCGCAKGQFETLKLLKERNANLWLRNAKGDLPLHEAASSGRRELVEWLLDQRPKQVNTTSNDGRSMLHIAAYNDYTDMCKMLLDYGADVNSVYRNSKGVVITPLDCALQKGHRSTAKFFQAHGGLPAGKLKLAARRSNPFDNTSMEVVRPLQYVEKEEIHDLSNSKKYVVYLKRSESDVGEDGNCSCTEQTYRREQRYAHTCHKHQKSKRYHLRRRTSSCGEPKESDHDGESICRSKSNIEIRRQKSRDRYLSSSEWEDEDDGEDSCENCCYHKRKKQRVIQRRKSTPSKRSRDRIDSDHKDDDDSGKETSSERKSESKDRKPLEQTEGEVIENENAAAMEPSSVPFSRAETPVKQTTESTPTAETKAPETAAATGTTTAAETSTVAAVATVDDIPLSTKVVVDQVPVTNAVELTDEDEQTRNAPENIVTEVQVHRGAEDPSTTEKSEEVVPSNETTEVQKTEEISNKATEAIEVTKTEKESAASLSATEELNDSEQIETIQVDKKQVVEEKHVQKSEEVAPNVTKEPQAATVHDDTMPETSVGVPAEPNVAIAPVIDKKVEPFAPPNPKSSDITTPQEQQLESEEKPTDTSSKPKTTSNEVTPAIDANEKNGEIVAADDTPPNREQESRRSFTLLPSDSAEDEPNMPPPESIMRKSSFQVLKSDDSVAEVDGSNSPRDDVELSDSTVFKVLSDAHNQHSDGDSNKSEDLGVEHVEVHDDDVHQDLRFAAQQEGGMSSTIGTSPYDYSSGRKRRLKKRVRSGVKSRSNWQRTDADPSEVQQSTRDQDSGFEPSPRTLRTKIPTPRNVYTAHLPRRPLYTTLDGRSCSSRLENRKAGDKGACDMSAVTRSIQRNIRRYYMERKIFQHLLELKSLQIRSNKLNEAVLVKRAVDDYHKSCVALGGETGTRLRRYNFSEYTFKNFELFLYETLKALQKPGTYNFQNINEVYEEAERRLSPDYNAYEKALQCTTRTHRCLHAAHAYTGIPCAAYIPMMNHHTMPKFGFGPYKKTGVGSFYLPKILTTGTGCSGKVALELSHGKNKQLISLPSDKLDSNKRYFVTFTVKETDKTASGQGCEGNVAGEGGGAATSPDRQRANDMK